MSPASSAIWPPEADDACAAQTPHRAAFGAARAQPLGLVHGAGHVLDVVADLVGDDVGAGEVALGAELGLQLVPEGEVEVHLAVGRAVERPHRRLPRAAAGAGRLVVEHHGRGRRVVAAGLLEDPAPDIGGRGLDHIAEAAGFVGGRALDAGLLLHRRAAAENGGGGRRVDAEDEIADQGQHDAADAHAAYADRAQAPAVLDVS